jgi:hypothetical protein
MKHFKQLVWLAVLGLVACVNSAFGQGVQTPTLAFPVITNAFTTVESIVLDTRKQENVAVALTFSQSAATNALPLTLTFARSVDGVTASDGDKFTWAYNRSAVSTTQVATTNIAVSGYPYLILQSIAAPGTGANLVTVSSFKYFVKFMTSR